jgi:ABC-type dipeptide/oligopeptide/nickel transport system permease subunit
VSAVATSRSAARRLRRVSVLRSNAGRVGVVLLVGAVGVALFGRYFAPYSDTATLGVPGAAPGGGHALGLDFIGRDVLSRTLYGGRSTLILAGLATLITYTLGGAIGLIAGISRSLVDPILMRGVDILLSVPALLVILLLVTAFGINAPVLVVATSLVLLPGVARIIRSATLEVSTRGFVESAIARGEPTRSLLVREVLPNISGIVTADLGLRFSWAIILIASVNFLGIGIQPPTPDWGVMISENRVVLGSNPMAVVAPSVMLAVLIVGVNLVGDAYVRQLDRSTDDE